MYTWPLTAFQDNTLTKVSWNVNKSKIVKCLIIKKVTRKKSWIIKCQISCAALAVGNLGPWPPFSRPVSLRFFCPYGSCVHLSMRGTVHGLEGRMEGAGMILAASGRGGGKILEWFPSGLYGAEITGWCFLELLLLVPQQKITCGSTPWVLGVTAASRGSWSPSDPLRLRPSLLHHYCGGRSLESLNWNLPHLNTKSGFCFLAKFWLIYQSSRKWEF